MTDYIRKDPGLETLLELNGEKFLMDNGYWTKIEARQVNPKDEIPHGIKYSLTLHDRNNKRILGYDNAHDANAKKGMFGAIRIEWDHKHENEKVEPYEFDTAGQLLEDFWADVNKIVSSR